MSVCALALAAGGVLPALADADAAPLGMSDASTGDMLRFAPSSVGIYAFTVLAPGAGAKAGVPPVAEATPPSGADLLIWNVALPKPEPRPPMAAVALPRPAERNQSSNISRLASDLMSRTRELAGRITTRAMHFVGTPYVFGGTSIYGFDCSGYVQHVFAMVGIRLPRTADAQYLVGRHIAQHQMVRGDLVFFTTYLPGVSHVGIYLGNGNFIHSSNRGVGVSNLHENYWSSRYVGATHIIGANLVGAHLVN
jgi:cell wall-associated NlpC family hydrolase